MGYFSVDGGCHYFVARNEMHVFLWVLAHESIFSESHKKMLTILSTMKQWHIITNTTLQMMAVTYNLTISW